MQSLPDLSRLSLANTGEFHTIEESDDEGGDWADSVEQEREEMRKRAKAALKAALERAADGCDKDTDCAKARADANTEPDVGPEGPFCPISQERLEYGCDEHGKIKSKAVGRKSQKVDRDCAVTFRVLIKANGKEKYTYYEAKKLWDWVKNNSEDPFRKRVWREDWFALYNKYGNKKDIPRWANYLPRKNKDDGGYTTDDGVESGAGDDLRLNVQELLDLAEAEYTFLAESESLADVNVKLDVASRVAAHIADFLEQQERAWSELFWGDDTFVVAINVIEKAFSGRGESTRIAVRDYRQHLFHDNAMTEMLVNGLFSTITSYNDIPVAVVKSAIVLLSRFLAQAFYPVMPKKWEDASVNSGMYTLLRDLNSEGLLYNALKSFVDNTDPDPSVEEGRLDPYLAALHVMHYLKYNSRTLVVPTWLLDDPRPLSLDTVGDTNILRVASEVQRLHQPVEGLPQPEVIEIINGSNLDDEFLQNSHPTERKMRNAVDWYCLTILSHGLEGPMGATNLLMRRLLVYAVSNATSKLGTVDTVLGFFWKRIARDTAFLGVDDYRPDMLNVKVPGADEFCNVERAKLEECLEMIAGDLQTPVGRPDE